MNCPSCGTQNLENSTFCITCGHNLHDTTTQKTQTFTGNNENIGNSQVTQAYYNEQTNINRANSVNSGMQMSISECFFIALAVILKPFTAFKEEIHKFDQFKNSAIVAFVISILATIISLGRTMFYTVRETSFWSKKVEWAWENLKEINYVQVIGKSLLLYLGIMVAIAAIYYIASLVIKKKANFSRLFGIAAVSLVPMIVCSLILSPLVSMIYGPLGMGMMLIGGIYTILIMYETINHELLLEGNIKYYFNLICLSILGCTAYYLFTKFFMGSMSDEFENIFNILGN